MRKTANQLWEYLKKYWVYGFFILTGLTTAIILDRFIWCNLFTVRNVELCTLLGQSAWEWSKLLIGPTLVIIIGILLNRFFKFRDENKLKQDKEIEVDSIRQNALIKYFDRMTYLLISEEWIKKNDISKQNNKPVSDLPIVAIAQAITLATLNELDSKRIRSLIIFLSNSKALNHFSLEYTNLKGADLRGIILCNADFGHADLRGTDLYKADLRNTNFIDADLRNAHFGGSNLEDANLDIARLKGANFSFSKLIKATLKYADLSNADFRNANLEGADLSGANLKDADFSSAILSQANLRNTDLSNANLSGANLESADLNGADLSNTDLCSSNLNGVKIHNIESIKLAVNWRKAKYDKEKSQKLGILTTELLNEPDQDQF